MTYETIRVEVGPDDGVALLTFDRPQARNALNAAMVGETRRAIDDLAARGDVKALILTGAGEKAFVSGADIAELRDRDRLDALRRINSGLFRALEALPFPTIAAIRGFALGGGCELALACDLRVCGEGARLGQPEVGLGILPGAGACYRLPRLVGPGVAKELIFTGRVIDAAEARAIGLVNRVVPDGEVLDVARAIAAEIARNSALAVRLAKSALNLAHEGSTDALQAFECTAQAVLFEDEEKRRRMTAFLEKRAHRRPTLAVGGLCEAPAELGREELARLPEAEQVPDVGAVVPGKKGRAVRLAGVLRAARPAEDVTHVALSSSDGKARASLTLEEAAHAVVVYGLRDQPLPEDQGGPFRLLLPPGGDACRNVKHVARVELAREAAGDLCGHTPEQHAKMRGA
ncbi:MAG: enoyl-CoA hydratase/isomerase family protein [Planctomycetes bacterium]|nr:enoyl-CoA hydratase/isomerase family protein [Planctomycetota bacterium]